MAKQYRAKDRAKDLVCYSHLRWGFVYQRPQHLMSRFARDRRTFFIEEPEYTDHPQPSLRERVCGPSGVRVMTPLIPRETEPWRATTISAALIGKMFASEGIEDHVAWLYTPMALDVMPPVRPAAIVYDCMDELSLFDGAPSGLLAKERELFQVADLVFTGGMSLFEAKRRRHAAVYAFPSGVDSDHFLRARALADEMRDQKELPHPRLGYAGVIDERIDLPLIASIADAQPDWQVIMVGPIAKIDPVSLPQRPNIHWLGMKPYSDLPRYFAGWDLALMPFAMNNATRYISPTKTPEYLAAGLAVVSTPIRDVVTQYGKLGLARIAYSTQEFIREASHALTFGMSMKWRERVDAFIRTLSWENTFQEMNALIDGITGEPGPEATIVNAPEPMLSGGIA